MSMLTPVSKVMFMDQEPSEVASLDIYIMPSTPLSFCSSGARVVFIMTSGDAPEYEPLTFTAGGAMFGYCVSDSWENAMRPTNVMNTDITVAKIGLSMKKWENFMALELFQDGGDLFLRNRAADSVYYDLFAPVEPRGNHLQLADELAGRHRPVFDHVFGIDYVYEPPHEVRADRRLGDEKPLGGSARPQLHSRVHAREERAGRVVDFRAQLEARGVQCVVDVGHLSEVRGRGLVEQLQAHGRPLPLLGVYRVEKADFIVFYDVPLADFKISVHRVAGDHARHEGVGGVYEVALVHEAAADVAGNRGGYARELEVELGLFEFCLV